MPTLPKMTLLAALLLIPAMAQAQQPRQPDANQGAALAKEWCSSCHVVGTEAAGRGTDATPTFVRIAKDPKKGPDFVRGMLANPHPPMPPLEIGAAAIEDIVAYFRYLQQTK
jgi:mono/diheme cytochrome c family protein